MQEALLGHVETVNVLIKAGADLNRTNSDVDHYARNITRFR